VSYRSTAANVHDSQVLEDLIDGEDEAVFVDSAYTSKSSDERLLKHDCQNFIQFKAQRVHPLTAEEIATNKLRSRNRVRYEHIFGRMSQMALNRLRSIGLARATQHIGLSNLFTIWIAMHSCAKRPQIDLEATVQSRKKQKSPVKMSRKSKQIFGLFQKFDSHPNTDHNHLVFIGTFYTDLGGLLK
jgi:hypothetical protein